MCPVERVGQAWMEIDRLPQIEEGPRERLRRSRGVAELHSARIGGAFTVAPEGCQRQPLCVERCMVHTK
jgi:hypothetical protein